MNQTPAKDAATATVIWVIVHCLFWLSLFVIGYFVIPRFKRLFFDFGIELPGPTLTVLIVSDWIVEFFYFFPFVLALPALADGAVMYMLYQQSSSPGLRRAWLLFMVALPAGVAIFAMFALFVSLAKLRMELSG